MFRLTVILILALVCSTLVPVTEAGFKGMDFVLRFEGQAKKGQPFSTKGPSQQIKTTISSTDAVHFTVTDEIGSFCNH